jgi:hypothetical protein
MPTYEYMWMSIEDVFFEYELFMTHQGEYKFISKCRAQWEIKICSWKFLHLRPFESSKNTF